MPSDCQNHGSETGPLCGLVENLIARSESTEIIGFFEAKTLIILRAPGTFSVGPLFLQSSRGHGGGHGGGMEDPPPKTT